MRPWAHPPRARDTTMMRDEMTTARLAGAIVQGAALDTTKAGDLVNVPTEKLDSDDLVFRVTGSHLQQFGIERGDLLIVEPRPDGVAATAELVLVVLDERAYVGRWWTKHGRRTLLDHTFAPIAEGEALRVIGAVTVIVRESDK